MNAHLSPRRGRQVKPANAFADVWLVSIGAAPAAGVVNDTFGDIV
jgi:hypothetical protein